MAQLPDLDKHSLGALSQPPGRSITAAPPPKYIQAAINTCRKNTTFQKPISTWHALHCTSKLDNWNFLKHRYGKLERHVNKISDLDQPSFAAMSCDKWHWQTSTCVWDHICHQVDQQGKHTNEYKCKLCLNNFFYTRPY